MESTGCPIPKGATSKLFIFIFMEDSLECATNLEALIKRILIEDISCPLCSREPETLTIFSSHAL